MNNNQNFGKEIVEHLLIIRQSDKVQELFKETKYRVPCPAMRIDSSQYIDLMPNDKIPITFTEYGSVQPIFYHEDKNKPVDENGFYYKTTRSNDCTDFEGRQTRRNLGDIVDANGKDIVTMEMVKEHITGCIEAHIKDRKWVNDRRRF